MTMSLASANDAFLDDFVGPLVIQPALKRSVAAQVSTVFQATTRNSTFRVPIVTDDPSAAWVSENEEITPDDASFDEAESNYRKLAALTRVSNELADDSDPEAVELIGQGMARDLARKIDAAFFGPDTNPKAPDGLETTTPTDIDSAGYVNLDPFDEALAEAETLGVELTSWVTDPATGLALSQLKDQDGSNRTLLGNDPAQPTRRQIRGLPLFVSPAVVEGVTWGIPQDLSMVAMRLDANSPSIAAGTSSSTRRASERSPDARSRSRSNPR